MPADAARGTGTSTARRRPHPGVASPGSGLPGSLRHVAPPAPSWRRWKLRAASCSALALSTTGLAPTVGTGTLAVIFTSLRTEGDQGYAQTADEMVRLASTQPGFLGVESARSEDGLGITVSYWRDEASIAAWRAHADHQAAQAAGKARWYRAYRVRVCGVEREYGFGG